MVDFRIAALKPIYYLSTSNGGRSSSHYLLLDYYNLVVEVAA